MSKRNRFIDGLSRDGTALAGYDYLGQRVAWRAYNTTTPVVAAYGYDMLGRVAEIDAGTGRVNLADYAIFASTWLK